MQQPPLPLIRPRMPELDSLRGTAVLMVLFFHGFYLSAGATRFHGPFRLFLFSTDVGWMGVNLFFVLSGFLITGILIDSRERRDYYRKFYSRRALRILPAYYGILLVILAVSEMKLTARRMSLEFFGLSLIYLANLTPLFGVGMQYAVLWSLAVEEHFYLIWPAIVRNASGRALRRICGSVIASSIGLRLLYFRQHHDCSAPYTWLLLDGLAWGALLASWARGRFSRPSAMLRLALACAGGSLLAVVAFIPARITSSGSFAGAVFAQPLINCFFAGVLALTLVLGTSSYKAIFAPAALKFFSEISYGLYLVHMLAFDIVDRVLRLWGLQVSWSSGTEALIFARFIAGASLSVVLAYLSRWHFEETFLRLKHQHHRQAQPAEMPAALVVRAVP
ncbi:MAG: acyltransferase [Candidatus Sulfotelmatobacter sp.]